jgi:hypothetical protein
MTTMDTQRIKAIMAGLGWDHGAHRLYDLGRREKTPRKGFARGDADERKVEYVARRIDGGIVIIDRIDALHGEEPPF